MKHSKIDFDVLWGLLASEVNDDKDTPRYFNNRDVFKGIIASVYEAGESTSVKQAKETLDKLEIW